MAVKRRAIILVAIFVILAVAVWGYVVMQQNEYKQEIAEKYGLNPEDITDIKPSAYGTIIELKDSEKYYVGEETIEKLTDKKIRQIYTGGA